MKVIHCPECESTGVLVGLDQINSTVCENCMDLKYMSDWHRKSHIHSRAKVKPSSPSYPTRVESGHESDNLPILTTGERAVIALIHPAITVTKNFTANKHTNRRAFLCFKIHRQLGPRFYLEPICRTVLLLSNVRSKTQVRNI